METENRRNIIIKDIGRPRIRSSRPVPPSEGQRPDTITPPPQVQKPAPEPDGAR